MQVRNVNASSASISYWNSETVKIMCKVIQMNKLDATMIY